MTDSAERLAARMGHRFAQPELLREALNHRSATGPSNERLEFLGDSILNFTIAASLFELYPKASEGELTRLRSSLVRGETLAAVARELDLGECLTFGQGELKNGARRRSSILADGFEAVLGGIYLDAGFETCRRIVLRLFDGRLRALALADSLKDPKSKLQEYLQAQGQQPPGYEVLSITGADHQREFRIVCTLRGFSTLGTGESRRRAEQAAAAKALEQLNGQPDDVAANQTSSAPGPNPDNGAQTTTQKRRVP